VVVYDNPCLGEPVALYGELHLVLTVTSDHGGFRVGSHLNGSYAGTGLVTGVPYRASESTQAEPGATLAGSTTAWNRAALQGRRSGGTSVRQSCSVATPQVGVLSHSGRRVAICRVRTRWPGRPSGRSRPWRDQQVLQEAAVRV
jgi:hypothetical protein